MITTGSRLGPYEVTAQLGAGGMGEVYRAVDSRLDRTVAIKILPQRLSADPRLRERFEREAKAISALTHPNICTLYDIGSHEGTDFLVMEYLDGESLADRLGKGPLPLEQVIRIGTEIAEALERAHRAGIVHRDLKPGNIVLTKSGAKLLDFGLAKFAQPQSDPNAPTLAMTQHKPLTEEGTIVGTFQYMAPEQIEGRDADARTDIFALGVVLYEMTTGKRAFDAKTRASLIASILDREPPPISAVQPLAPAAFERVVRMCLAKDPDERWQSAHDVAAELKWIGATSSDTIGPGVKRRTRRAWLRGAALLAIGLLAGAAIAWLATRRTETPRRLARFSVATAPDAPLLLLQNSLLFSPDGNHILYRGRAGSSSTKLYLRAVDDLVARPVDGTDGAFAASFSPDGQSIAFVARESLWKVPREGGTPSRIAENTGGLGVTWQGDTIVINKLFSGGLVAIPANGGPERQIVKGDRAQNAHAIVWPELLPGGKHVIATVWSAGPWDTARIVAYSMEDGSAKTLVTGGYFARYAPSGHLLFVRGGNLMAVTLDPGTLEVGATPAVVVTGVAHGPADGEASYALSANGHLVYTPGGTTAANDQLVWIDRAGKVSPMVPGIRRYGSIDVAEDGRTAAVTIEDSTYDMWLLDLERDSLERLSFGSDDFDGVLTPDGSRVVWMSSRSGVYNIYSRNVDMSSPEEVLAPSPKNQFNAFVTPDGRFILYGQEGTKADIWRYAVDTRKAEPLIATEHDESFPAVSPDGRWLAYMSNRSGRDEVYVTSFPKPGGSWQASIDGGTTPRWMPDGKSLVYEHKQDLYVVPIETAPRPRAGKPTLLAAGPFDNDFSIAADGRVAAVKEGPLPTASQFTVVLNWAEELKRRVPTR